MVERIVPKTPALAKREQKVIEDLRTLFPDGNVAGLDNKDKALGKRLSKLYRALGYESRADMIAALGFRQEADSRGGRPVTTDPEALFAELQRRYEGKPKPTAVGLLMHDNPDLSGTIKTVRNRCNELYGHTFTIELIERGLLDAEVPKRTSVVSDEEIIRAIDALEEKYAKDAGRPKSLDELKRREPDYAEILDLLAGRRSNKLFGMPAGKYLKSRYIIGVGVIGADEEGIAKVLDTLQELYRGKPNDDKPKTVAALIKAHPEYANVLKAGQKVQLVTRDILTERGILGLSQAALKARAKVLKERCVRNAKVSELVRMYAGSGGAEVVLPDKCVDYLRPGVVGVDLKYRYELREVIVTALDADLAVGDVLKTFHSVSTGWYNRGQLELFKGESRVAHIVRPGEDDFLVSKSYVDPTPLKQYEGAEVVSLETVAGRQLARIRYRFLSLISRETLLYALYRMGALNDVELYANDDSWRGRLEMMPEEPFQGEDVEANDVSELTEIVASETPTEQVTDRIGTESTTANRDAVASTQVSGNVVEGTADEVTGEGPSSVETASSDAQDEVASVIDGLIALANEVAPDCGPWTFDLHQRAQGRRFSVEVPDQWVLTPDEGGRPLARYEQGVEDEGEYPQIICSTMAGDLDEEMQATLRENVIPETRIQLSREAIYSNDAANTLSRVVDDWVVEGRNCQVMVFEILMPSIFPGLTPDSYEYHVKPVAYDHEDFLRLADSWNHLGEGQLKELAFAIAPTLELDRPVELERLAELDRYCDEPADADRFCALADGLSNMLNLSNNKRMNANLWREVRRNGNDKGCLLVAGAMPRIQAESFNTGLDDEVAYYGRLVEALERQRELGVDGFERMWKLVGEFGDVRVTDHVTMEDDEEASEAINSLGIISIPAGYQALHERWEALDPLATRGVVMEAADQSAGEVAQLQEEEKAARNAEAKARLKAEVEAARKAEEEARRKAEVEAARKAEEEARRKTEEEAKRKADEEKAARLAEIESARKAEAEVKQRMQDARIELNGAKGQLDSLTREREQLEAQMSEYDQQIHELRKTTRELKSVEDDLVSARKELDGLGFFAFGKKGELRKKIQQLEQSQKELGGKLPADVDESIKRLELQRDDVADELGGVKVKIAECRKRIDASATILVRPLVDSLSAVGKGDVLEFGRYPQSSSNASEEPIKWQVLEKKGDRLLLMSTLVLDNQVFNKTKEMGNDYQTSDLRRWMIHEFKTRAFGIDEQMLLDGDPFIMGLEDFKRYFESKSSRRCSQTKYAQSRGSSKGSGAFYWLSTAGDWGTGLVYYINPHGDILGSGNIIYSQGMSFGAIGLDVKYDSGVRPAVWVRTKL